MYDLSLISIVCPGLSFLLSAVPYWPASPVDKASWTVSGTGASGGDEARYGAANLMSAGDEVYFSEAADHPWVQVDMGTAQVVKGVRLEG